MSHHLEYRETEGILYAILFHDLSVLFDCCYGPFNVAESITRALEVGLVKTYMSIMILP